MNLQFKRFKVGDKVFVSQSYPPVACFRGIEGIISIPGVRKHSIKLKNPVFNPILGREVTMVLIPAEYVEKIRSLGHKLTKIFQ